MVDKFAIAPEFLGRTSLLHLIDMFRKLCNNFDIEIETNHKVTPLEIEDIRTYFDEVVYAAGSTPDWIDIQGAPSSKVYQYPDIFSARQSTYR